MNNEHTSVRCSNATGIDVGFGSEEYFLDLATTCEKCHQDHGDCKWSHGPKGAKKCVNKNFSQNFFNLNRKMNFSSEESIEESNE